MPEPSPNVVVSTIDCKTAEEFLSTLSPRNILYPSLSPQAWVFRGHADSKFPLVPSALRADCKAWGDLTFHECRDNKQQTSGEKSLLSTFLKVSDSAGLHVPEDTQKLRKLLSHRSRIERWPPDEVLSLMALAQHHGIPTRLLDWSRNPMKAALFAGMGAAERQDKSGSLCVWALCIEKLDLIAAGEETPTPFTIITAPAASNSNLRAQEGVFTLAKHITPDGSEIDRRAFDELLNAWIIENNAKSYGNPPPWFYKVTLPQEHADELCYNIALDGINQATLFPDFYGVVRSIKDAVRWNRDGGPGRVRGDAHMPNCAISTTKTIERFMPTPRDRSTLDFPTGRARRLAKMFSADTTSFSAEEGLQNAAIHRASEVRLRERKNAAKGKKESAAKGKQGGSLSP